MKRVIKENESGLIYVPYRIITTKAIISDENGTREIWQINKWERFKLWINVLFYKITKGYFQHHKFNENGRSYDKKLSKQFYEHITISKNFGELSHPDKKLENEEKN